MLSTGCVQKSTPCPAATMLFDAADVGRPPHQTLADAHHLDSPCDVHRPFPGAVLAGQLADPGVDAEGFERFDHDTGHALESLPDPDPGLGLGEGQ